jgi:hypothetical protein
MSQRTATYFINVASTPQDANVGKDKTVNKVELQRITEFLDFFHCPVS